ncbi:MAG: T9SS type A sorting domain-containing protein [Deferribacteres bacterium]|nr:T9SS type A sorting domain-containing protein [candidate division KSB1 bacterium]MCB9510986.1 T9SS type A sorting domain-containing protein [Deferribacteres bacterium]
MSRKINRLIISAFFMLQIGASSHIVFSQTNSLPGIWQTKGPQFHAEISGIIADAQDDLLMHLGTRGPEVNVLTGLFRSTDGGVSWQLADDEQLNDVNVMTLFEVNDILFVSVINFDQPDNSGLYLSFDKGESWQRATGDMADKTALSIIEKNGVLYAGGLPINFIEDIEANTFGLFRSFDDGESWETVPAMSGRLVTSLAVSDNKIYAGTGGALPSRGAFLAGEPGTYGIFVSEDDGASWQEFLPNERIEAMYAFNDQILAGTRDSGLFVATEFDLNWTHPQADGVVLDFGKIGHITSVFQDSLLAITLFDGDPQDEVLYSADGQNWFVLNSTASPITQMISDLHPTTPFLFIGTENEGAIRVVNITKSEGLQNAIWVEAEAPLAGTFVTALAANAGGNDAFAGTRSNGLFRAPTGAPVWFPTSPQATHIATQGVEISNERTLFAYGAGSGVYRSLDGGESWQASVTQFPIPVMSLIYHFEQDWFVLGSYLPDKQGGSLGIWRSRDGLNWETTGLDSVRLNQFLINEDGDVIFAATDKGVYRTPGDTGGEWLHVLGQGNAFVIKEVPGVGFWAGLQEPSSGLYFSEDGDNWQKIDAFGDFAVTAITTFQSQVFVGTRGNGVYFSPDGFGNWQKATIGFRDEAATAITQLQTVGGEEYILAGTGGFPGDETDDQGMYFSSNGVEWIPTNNVDVDHVRMDNKDIQKIIELDSVVYVATDGQGIFRSEKYDLESWFPLNTGLTDLNTRNIRYMRGTNQLILSTLEGVFTQKLDVINPVLEFFDIGGGKGFENSDYTNSRDVRFFIYAYDSLADGNFNNPNFMRISENEDFSDTEWIEYNDNIDFSEPNFTLSEGDGAKTIFAQVRDHSWNLSEVLSWEIVLDQTPPQFDAHTPPADARVGQPITVSFSVTEPNIESVTFRLRRPGQQWNPLRSFTFFDDTDGGWDIEVPGEFINNNGFDYRIFATDLAGNVDTLRYNNLDFVSLPINLIESELGNSNSLPAGGGASAYRMVSAPMDLQNTPAVKDVFRDLGKYGRRGKWRFYAYQGNSQWQEGDNILMQTGSGYFMIRRDGGPLTNKMVGTTTRTSDGITGAIPGWQLSANDWTLIGNPYNARLALGQLMLQSDSTLLSDDSMAGQIWYYDGSWKNPQTTPDLALEAWSGLFVRASQADTIVFASAADPFKPASKVSFPDAAFRESTVSSNTQSKLYAKRATDEKNGVQLLQSSELPRRSKTNPKRLAYFKKHFPALVVVETSNVIDQHQPSQNSTAEATTSEAPDALLSKSSETEWLVQIIATSEDVADKINYFGVKKDASLNLDKYDWYEPPFLFEGASVAFPHANWNTPVELTADIRPAGASGHRWEIAVKGQPGYAAQLSFANLASVPENLQIIMVDEATQIVRDLRKESSFAVRIPADTNSRELSILVGDGRFMSQNVHGLLGTPTAFALRQNYPNPFNPSTTIRYELPVAGEVTLKIFDLMGREVATLVDGVQREAGYYEVVADMRQMGSGMYFYRLSVKGEQNFQTMQKMTLLK